MSLGVKEYVLLHATLGFAIQHAVKTDKPDAVHRELQRVRGLVEKKLDELTRKNVGKKAHETKRE